MIYRSNNNCIDMDINSLEEKFRKRWKECYEITRGTKQPFGVRQQFEFRHVGQYCIINNNQYKNKRETGSIDKALSIKDITQPYSHLGFNFNQIQSTQILLAVSSDQLQLQNFTYFENNEHFVIISGAPIAEGHSLFVPYLKENHPQIIDEKLLRIVLKLKSMFLHWKFGFNSQGAASSVNHFHIQMMDCTKFLAKNRFSFEDKQGVALWQVKNQDNKIQLQYFEWQYACYVKVHSLKPLASQVQTVTPILINIFDILLASKIPHNVIFTDANTIYIIARGFANGKFKYGWLEYCGVFVAKSEQQYQMTTQAIQDSFKELKIDSKLNIIQSIKERLSQSKTNGY